MKNMMVGKVSHTPSKRRRCTNFLLFSFSGKPNHFNENEETVCPRGVVSVQSQKKF